MRSGVRTAPEVVACRVLTERYERVRAAVLAGSVVRGEATATSDLDMVIVLETLDTPYRESFVLDSWPVEAFLHNPVSWPSFFADDAERRRPSLPRMCAEGTILVDVDGLATHMKAEAQALIDAGPKPLTNAELRARRYRLTDLLADFVGSQVRGEIYVIANELAMAAAEFLLLVNGQWLGRSKWLYRGLARLNPAAAERLTAALEAVYGLDSRDELLRWVEEVLAPVGGRLFEGYRVDSGWRPDV
jgi:hypothetical protein